MNSIQLEYCIAHLHSTGHWAVLRRHSHDWFKIISSHPTEREAAFHADTLNLTARIRATQQEAKS